MIPADHSSSTADGQLFPVRPDRGFALALLAVLALKAFTIITYGPYAPANNMFVDALSNVALSGSEWLFGVGEQDQAMPLLTWRPMGYALVAALMKLSLGQHWMWGIYLLQSGLSLLAGLFVRRLMLSLGQGATAAAAAFLLFECSVPLLNDMLLLADSLPASLATMVLCALFSRFAENRPPSPRWAMATGTAMAACFLLRDTYALIAIIPAAILAFLLVRSHRNMVQVLLPTACFLAPLMACYAGISAWNHARTGTAFITTQGQHGYLYAVLKVAQHEPAVFSQDTPLDRIARRGFVDYDDADTIRINKALVQEQGMTAVQLVALMKEKFYWTLRTHPRAFLASAREKLDFSRQAVQIGDPLHQLDELDSWSNQPAFWTDWRLRIQRFKETSDLSVLDQGAALRLLPRMVSRMFGSVLFKAFAFVLPLLALWRLLRSPAPLTSRRHEVVLLCWVTYVAVLVLYLPVNVHSRYLASVTFIPIMGAVILLAEAWRLTQRVQHVWHGQYPQAPHAGKTGIDTDP